MKGGMSYGGDNALTSGQDTSKYPMPGHYPAGQGTPMPKDGDKTSGQKGA